MKKVQLITYIVGVISSFLSYSQEKEYDYDNLNELISNPPSCTSVFEITSDTLILNNQKEISAKKVYRIVKRLYKKCESESTIAFIADWEGNYNIIPYEFEDVHDIVIQAIEELQQKLSLKIYSKPLDSLTLKEWYRIENTYPLNIKSTWCCTQ